MTSREDYPKLETWEKTTFEIWGQTELLVKINRITQARVGLIENPLTGGKAHKAWCYSCQESNNPTTRSNAIIWVLRHYDVVHNKLEVDRAGG